MSFRKLFALYESQTASSTGDDNNRYATHTKADDSGEK